MQIDQIARQIDYVAPQHVRDVVASLGRTEDVRFSPSNRRLAVVELWKNRITVFEVSIPASQNPKNIFLTGVAEISSTYLRCPHGLDFIDDENILVANREGQPCIFKLPLDATGNYELEPLAVIRSDEILAPGSCAVISNEEGLYEALICNNYAHSVTSHLLNLDAGYSIKNDKVLLRRWLDIPDGICVSRDTRWIAVSNHSAHAVLLYKNNGSLNESCSPVGILRRVEYPHGLRFTSDGRFILVADGGSPYVNIYETSDSDWQGVRDPLLSLRLLKNEDFLRAHHNPEEGGPKGIDINKANSILVMACESQPLAFFDWVTILESACSVRDLQRREIMSPPSAAHKSADSSDYMHPGSWLHNQPAVIYELYLGRTKATARSVLRRVRTNWHRITRVLRGISHPSFIRIVRYLIVALGRRVIGVDRGGNGSHLSDGKQNLIPIPKQVAPEPSQIGEISRVIFQTWKSRIDIPPNYRYWRSTFIRNNPEFKCVLWDDDDNREFITERFPWFLSTYNRLPAAIFRADAVRPLFLFSYGGLYADMDTECLRPLVTMPFSGDVILGQMGPDLNFEQSIPNAIMASKPFQLFWLVVIVLMMEKVESRGRDLRRAAPESLTGPALLHEAFDFYRSESEKNIRLRTLPIIEKLPEEVSALVKAGRIELLPPDVWYPIAWTNPFHKRFGSFLQRNGILLAPADACLLFPKASLVTYWTHSW